MPLVKYMATRMGLSKAVFLLEVRRNFQGSTSPFLLQREARFDQERGHWYTHLPHISPCRARGMSVSHSEAAEPARALDLDWDALRWRKLEWGALPHTTRKGTIPYLTVREAGRLDCAMTNREATAPGQILQGHGVA